MKNKGLVDVEDGIDEVQKFDLDGEGRLRRTPAGCGPLLLHSVGCCLLSASCGLPRLGRGLLQLGHGLLQVAGVGCCRQERGSRRPGQGSRWPEGRQSR